MTTATETMRCDHCGDMYADAAHVERCTDRKRVLADLVKYAAEIPDRPMERRQVHELANFLSRDGDYAMGARAARTVIDLGWRPVVGVKPSP